MLNQTEFPNELKLADVTLILKKEDPSRTKNYKPISILPIVSKIFERILHKQVSSYVDQFLNVEISNHPFKKTKTAIGKFKTKVVDFGIFMHIPS